MLIALDNIFVKIALIGDDITKQRMSSVIEALMLLNGADMVRLGVTDGLPGLSHDVADKILSRAAFHHRLLNAVHKQMRNDRRIEASRPQNDDIGFQNGLNGLRKRLGGVFERNPGDRRFVVDGGFGKLGFSFKTAAVFKFADKGHVIEGHRQHSSADLKHVGGAFDSVIKIGADAVHRRQKQIAEAVAFESAFVKAVVEQ